jgi:hypothetical protein
VATANSLGDSYKNHPWSKHCKAVKNTNKLPTAIALEGKEEVKKKQAEVRQYSSIHLFLKKTKKLHLPFEMNLCEL